MNKSKFSLADVLTALAAINFGFIAFLGANFLNVENDKVWGMPHTAGCVVMAIFIAALLGGTAFSAKLLKRTSVNFKTCFIWEVICLVFFVLFAVFFASKASPFPHYFTVTTHKTEIQNNLKKSIEQAENMFPAYETYASNRENLYENKLKAVVAAKSTNPAEYAEYGFNDTSGVDDASQIETKMFTVHADLFPSNYSDPVSNDGLKEIATSWLQKAKNITTAWKPIGIGNVVNDIEKNSNEWLSSLVTYSQKTQPGEQATDFEYNLSFDEVKTYFTTLNSPTNLSIFLAIPAYVLMLLSWYVTKRSTKIGNFKYLLSLFFPFKSNNNSGSKEL